MLRSLFSFKSRMAIGLCRNWVLQLQSYTICHAQAEFVSLLQLAFRCASAVASLFHQGPPGGCAAATASRSTMAPSTCTAVRHIFQATSRKVLTMGAANAALSSPTRMNEIADRRMVEGLEGIESRMPDRPFMRKCPNPTGSRGIVTKEAQMG